MTKKWLLNMALILILLGLVGAYLFTTSRLNTDRSLLSPRYRSQPVITGRVSLTQAPLLSNYYVVDNEQVDGLMLTTSVGATDCRVRATLDARHEESAQATNTVYDLDFEGTYRIGYAGLAPTSTLEIVFPFPEGLDTLNQVYFLVDGEEPAGVQYSLSNITWWSELASGESREVVVRYRARGVESFTYALDRNRRVENLDMAIDVRGLTGSQVPDSALPTTDITTEEEAERFAWRYEALIVDRNVRVDLPTQPTFAQRVARMQAELHDLSQIAPLLVVLFLLSLAGVHWLSGLRLPLQDYLLVGVGFFLFYPALTFLSGAFDLAWGTVVASICTTALLTAFLGSVAGWRRTWWQTLLLCGIFLGLFSISIVSQWRGLWITTGGLLLLGFFMALIVRRQHYAPPEGQLLHCPACGAQLDTSGD